MTGAITATVAAHDPDFAVLRRRTAARYAACRRMTRHFVSWKLRLDPVHAAVLAVAGETPLGCVVDLGCGRGQLGVLLAEAGLADNVLALDWDERRLEDGRLAAVGLPVAFASADARAAALPSCDTLLLVDVLLELPLAEQLALLGRAAAATRRRILIRTFDPARGWRSAVGRAAEALGQRLRLDRAVTREPAPLAAITGALAAQGFAARVAPCWGGTPFPNVLVVAERRHKQGQA